MADARPMDEEIWIFPFEWFQETNEAAKRSLHADFVALLQLGQSGRRSYVRSSCSACSAKPM